METGKVFMVSYSIKRIQEAEQMKLTEHLLKISGVEYETNSNCYAMIYDGGIVLIDCGYSGLQWDRMEAALRRWGHSLKEVTHVFLTHAHFDHGGNARKVNELGAKLLASGSDVYKIEKANPESERLFGSPLIPGRVDQVLRDGDRFSFPGGASVTAFETPGHSAGSLSFLVEADGCRALAAGDMFWPIACPPEDRDDVELGFMGSDDFSLEALIASLEKLAALDADILLSGHYHVFFGDVSRMVDLALAKAKRIKEEGK